MGDIPGTANSELYQDVISQFPFLNGYTHLVLGFQVNDGASRDAILVALRSGVAKLTAQIAWLSGQVVHVPGGPGNSGLFKLTPWPADSAPNEIVRFRDCDNLAPTMAQLLRAGPPIGMLDGKILTPFPGLPQHHGLTSPAPIIALQANFIHGGLLLNMSFHHIAIDATGITQFIRLLSTVLDGGKISAADLEQANRDRSRVVPLLSNDEPVKDHDHLRRPPDFLPQMPASPPKWFTFKLPVLAAATLKKLASSSSSSTPILISENDAICAFCWQRISAVRLARGLPGFAPNTATTFYRAIDGRAAVGVPFSYMGHMVHFAKARLSLRQVVSAPLSNLAQTLRRELNAANTAWGLRSYATFIAREPDKSSLLYGGLRNPNTDLGATSSTISMGDSSEITWPPPFGSLLGTYRFLRRPDTPLAMAGSITIAPIENGAIPILLGLPEDDLEGLKQDLQWKKYTRLVG